MSSKAKAKQAYPIWLVLAVTFGGLAAAAIAFVAIAINWIAVDNTEQLLNSFANREITTLEQALLSELDPAMEQVRFLSGYMSGNNVEPTDEARLSDLLMGSLAASPQLIAVSFIRSDLTVIAASRQLDGKLYVTSVADAKYDAMFRQAYQAGIAASEPVWGDPIYLRILKRPVMTALGPVKYRGEPIGVFAAVVSLPGISATLNARSGENATPFVLDSGGSVFVHRNLFSGDFKLSSERPLPRFDEINDPILAQFDPRRSIEVRPPGAESEPFRQQQVETFGERYVLIYKDAPNRINRPLIVGVYLRLATLEMVFNPLQRTLFGAALVIVIAIILALLLGRRIGRPMRDLADATRHLAALDFNGAPELSRSSFAEIDVANRAYNKMRSGLGWFSTYVPKSLVPHLMRPSSSEVLASREVEVSVLFTDIVGFSGIAERLSPDRLAAFLNRHFTLLGEHIEDEGGSIDKYIGDSIMAFWGAPEAQADHAERAVRAARSIAQHLEADNARRARKGLRPVRIRIGIHSGRAIAGNIGAPGRINYTLVGDAVNIAQRLEQFGKQVDDGMASAIISISADAVRLLPPEIKVRPLGQEVLPGRSEETEIYRLD